MGIVLEIVLIQKVSRNPAVLTERLGQASPAAITAMGRVEILRHNRLGLICSIRCPGSIVIQTFDAIRDLRDAGLVVAGGFHSPMPVKSPG